MNRRSTLPLFGLVLLAGAAWLLFAGGSADPDAGLDAAAIEDGEARGDLLHADGADEAVRSAAPSLAGRSQSAADAPQRGPVRVRVLGAAGQPLPGVYVQTVAADRAKSAAADMLTVTAADANGVVELNDVPYDGSVAVRLFRTAFPRRQFVFARSDDGKSIVVVPAKMGSPSASAVVDGAEVTLRAAMGLPLRVEVLSSDRGRRLRSVAWRVLPRFDGLAFDALQKWGQPCPLPVAAGEDLNVKFYLSGDFDCHMASKEHEFDLQVHPSARRFHAVLPLRPMARIMVLFDAPEGSEGLAWSAQQLYAGKQTRARITVDALRRHIVNAVPHLPGEPIKFEGLLGNWEISASGRMPMDPAETLVLRADVKKVHVAEHTAMQKPKITWTSGKYGWSSSDVHVGFELAQPIELSFVKDGARKGRPPQPTFDVAVIDAHGEPVSSARVFVGKASATTNERGIARFVKLPGGTHPLKVWGAGPTWQNEVAVPNGTSASVRVQAPLPGTIRLEVVDEDGNPLPFVHLVVEQPSKLPWCDVAGGTQRMDRFTDHRGRRTLHNVEAGWITIEARLGGRAIQAGLEVRAGRTDRTRLVLR